MRKIIDWLMSPELIPWVYGVIHTIILITLLMDLFVWRPN